MNPALLLELLNGVWTISAISLAVICGSYLIHEARARFGRWPSLKLRKQMTRGMRVAAALLTLSIGIALRSAVVFFWRFGSGQLPQLDQLDQMWLLLGALISVVGFMCAIREMSIPLFGHLPWMLTLLATLAFVAIDVGVRFG